MEILYMIISLSCYLVASAITIYIAKIRFNKSITINESSEAQIVGNNRKLLYRDIVSCSFLFAVYNFVITKMSVNLSGDRINYYINYSGQRSSTSGVMFVMRLLHYFTSNVEWFFYFSTFATVFITLIAYKYCDEARPEALLFLLSTQYVFFTFSGMKQCYANALGCLFIVIALKKTTFKRILYCLILLILSVCFHPSGVMLVPLFLMIKLRKTRRIDTLVFTALLLTIVFLEPLLLFISTLITPIIPSVGTKITEYIGDNSIEALQTTGFLSVLKGIPYYIATLLGIYKRPKIKDRITNYDNYLILSAVISVIYIAQIYNGWIYRLAYFLYLPVGIYIIQLIRNLQLENNKKVFKVLILGLNAFFSFRYLMLIYILYGGF